MSITKYQIPNNHTVSLPTELIQLIAEHVVADNDTAALKSCSLAFKHLKIFFQQAILSKKPLTIMCIPSPYNSDRKKSLTTLAELLDANPSFGQDCIHGIRIFVVHAPTLADPSLRLDYILSQCTELQSFTVDRAFTRDVEMRCWTTFPQPTRDAMESILRLPSLRRVSFSCVSLPWTTLFRSKKSLDYLAAFYVGNMPRDGATTDGGGQTSDPLAFSTTIHHLNVCPSSARVLSKALAIDPVPAETPSFAFDFTNLHTLELLFRHVPTGAGTTWQSDVRTLLRRAPTLRKLVFKEIQLDDMTGLFEFESPLACLTTLEHISWPESLSWPDAYAGCHPFLLIAKVLQAFPSENALKDLAITARFENLPTDRAQILADFRALPDALAKQHFRLFKKLQVCAQVEALSSRTVQVERMTADLRHVEQELQRMNYPFVLEMQVEEWD